MPKLAKIKDRTSAYIYSIINDNSRHMKESIDLSPGTPYPL